MAENKSKSGFASMDDDKQREIASKGGQSVPDEKRSFSKDPELAAEAGRKGGENSHGGQQNDSSSGGRGRQSGSSEGDGKSSESGNRGGRSSGDDKR